MQRLLKNRIFKNATWVVFGRLAQMVLNFFVGILTTRYLGPANYGLINYASSVIAFVVPIMQLGLSSILVQEIVNAPDREGETVGTTLLLSVCSSVLCMVGAMAFVSIANAGEKETILICFLYSFLLVFQALELIVYWFQAKLKSKFTVVVSFLAYVIVATYKIVLILTKKSVYWFAVSQVINYALISLGYIVVYKKLGGKKLSFSWEAAKRMLARSKYYILSSMMVTVFSQTDRIMLKLMMNNTETGYYSAAIQVASLSMFVFIAIIDSMRPVILENKNVSEERFESSLRLLYSIVIYFSLIQCLIMTLLSKYIIQVLYGAAYLPATSALQIGVWYTTFAHLGTTRDIWILANEKQEYLWKINITGAVTNVILNAILIPVLGINGAAIASLITQFATNVLAGFIIKPIRKNNAIMIQGINPQALWEIIKTRE